jgi:hypothetical protein
MSLAQILRVTELTWRDYWNYSTCGIVGFLVLYAYKFSKTKGEKR